MSIVTMPAIQMPRARDGVDVGLVGEWRFNRNTGLILPDCSGYGAHGDINGATWSPGEVGTYLDFNGDDYVPLVPSQTTFYDIVGGVNRYTIEVLTHCDSTDTRRSIVADWNSSGSLETICLEYGGYEQPTTVICAVQRYNDSGGGDMLNSGFTYSANTWYHIVVTWDGTTRRIYIDADEKNNDSPTGAWRKPPSGTLGTATIGRGGDVDGQYLDGGVALFRIYNRSLSAAEVSSRYEIVRRRGQSKPEQTHMPLHTKQSGLAVM